MIHIPISTAAAAEARRRRAMQYGRGLGAQPHIPVPKTPTKASGCSTRNRTAPILTWWGPEGAPECVGRPGRWARIRERLLALFSRSGRVRRGPGVRKGR
jgi:hypothetical protein